MVAIETYLLWRSLRFEWNVLHRPFQFRRGERKDQHRASILREYGRPLQVEVYTFLKKQEGKYGAMMPQALADVDWKMSDGALNSQLDYARLTIGHSDIDDEAYIVFVKIRREGRTAQGYTSASRDVPFDSELVLEHWKKFRIVVQDHPELFTPIAKGGKHPNDLRAGYLRTVDSREQMKIRSFLKRRSSR